MKQQITSPKLRQPNGHFSHATTIEARGKLVFISGMTARAADGSITGVGDIEAQTRQVCENLKAAAEAAAEVQQRLGLVQPHRLDQVQDVFGAAGCVEAFAPKPFDELDACGVPRVRGRLLLRRIGRYLADSEPWWPTPPHPGDAAPNVVIILFDDLGFSHFGCFGSTIETPNIDALARNGLRFTQFYNTARCCPTRAALLTGLYAHQAGVGHMVENQKLPGYVGHLNDSCVTMAEVLRIAACRRRLAVAKTVSGKSVRNGCFFTHSNRTPTGFSSNIFQRNRA